MMWYVCCLLFVVCGSVGFDGVGWVCADRGAIIVCWTGALVWSAKCKVWCGGEEWGAVRGGLGSYRFCGLTQCKICAVGSIL